MKKILVLGAGMVGRAMALDLSKKHSVCSADLSAEALKFFEDTGVKTMVLNAKDKTALSNAVAPYDFIVSAVPGYMGYETLKTCIEAGKNIVDISFFPENSLDLHELAVQKGVTAIVDCGVAPGIDNLVLGHLAGEMEIEDFLCVVGGLPKARKKPFEYKAPFSPIDVIEEYTRPARYKENGHIVVREALTDPEYMYFDQVGTLESFNTDGLRSLLFTMPQIPSMKEKTLRYPGHIQLISALKEAGFFSETKLELGNGTEVKPIDFTSKILFNEWKLGKNEKEFTVLRTVIKGNMKGKKVCITHDLYDEYDAASQTSSMARTTGYTATGALNMLAEGLFNDKGVFPPELVGKHSNCFHYIMKYLEERGIKISSKTEHI